MKALNTVSLPGSGWRGIISANNRPTIAIPVARPQPAPGEANQT